MWVIVCLFVLMWSCNGLVTWPVCTLPLTQWFLEIDTNFATLHRKVQHNGCMGILCYVNYSSQWMVGIRNISISRSELHNYWNSVLSQKFWISASLVYSWIYFGWLWQWFWHVCELFCSLINSCSAFLNLFLSNRLQLFSYYFN